MIDRPKPFVRLPLTGANIQLFIEIRVLDVNLVRTDSHDKICFPELALSFWLRPYRVSRDIELSPRHLSLQERHNISPRVNTRTHKVILEILEVRNHEDDIFSCNYIRPLGYRGSIHTREQKRRQQLGGAEDQDTLSAAVASWGDN